MEEADVDLKTPHDLASQVEAAMEAQRTGKVTRKKINTKNILFIVSGAFSGLEDIINKRLNKQAIGFDKSQIRREDRQSVLKQVKTEDLIEFGFESEFIGRLPVTVVLNDLDEEGLYKILKNKYSTVVLGKKLDFRAYGIDLEFMDEALKMLAAKAYKERTGARGLLSVFEKTLIKFEKTLPSTDIKKLVVDSVVVDNPESVLKNILLSDNIRKFQKEFLLKHGVVMEFDGEALQIIQEKAREAKMSIKQFCDDLFHDYPYGIKLMNLDRFVITKGAVENPQSYIDEYIRQYYSHKK